MKKGVKLFGIITIMVLFLTGCGNDNKTLSCTLSEDQDGVTMGQTMEIDFENDKMSYVTMSIDTKATDSLYEENWDLFSNMMASQFEEVEKDGFKITTTNDSDNKTFSVIIEVDPKKASTDDLDEYSLEDIVGDDSTYDELKNDLEEEGYTCK